MPKSNLNQIAKGPYRWLRISPILTVPTYFVLIAFGSNAGFALLGSALWHLLLLQYINNKENDFVRWHGLQAALIAGIRTLIPIAFLIFDSVTDSQGYFYCWTIPVLMIVWAFATPWGNKQVENGVCTLAKWTGNTITPPAPEIMDDDFQEANPQDLSSSFADLLLGLKSDDAVTRISTVIKLNSAKELNEDIRLQLEKLSMDDENFDVRKDARILLNKFIDQKATPLSDQPLTTEIDLNENISEKPEVILKKVLKDLQSEDSANRLGAIKRMAALSYSSEAIRNELEKLALHDPSKAVRVEALAALDLATQRNVRIRFNKIDRGNRYVLLQELKDWENLGFLEKQTADVIRRRYDFDFTTPPAPAAAPVQPAKPTPKPTPAQSVALAPVPMKAAQPVKMTTSGPVQTNAAPALSKPAPSAAAKPKPTAPPKPKQPPIDWKKVRERVADAASSGALLRALLYLGAFMIVISATVLVVRFWNVFNPILQILFIASVPLIFYFGGWTLRTRLKLIQGGTVLTGIGAILVAVDFAAIYQLGDLASTINGSVYWFIVAIFCTALYAFTTWKMRGEFFDYLTLLAGTGTFFTLASLVQLPVEWRVVSITASASAMTAIAGRFSQSSDNWGDLARASRYLSQILIPASVIFIVFSNASLPIMAAFVFATIAYSLLAWKLPSVIFAYSAVAASIGAVIYALRVADMSSHWYATIGSILALAYILIGQLVKRSKIETSIIQNYIKALNSTAFILIGLTVLDGLSITFVKNSYWPGVIALAISSLDLAICAYLFKQSRFTLFAGGLVIFPFTLAVTKWLKDAHALQALTWLTVTWGILALSYILLAALIQKENKHARWLYAWAHILIPIALFMNYFDYLTTAGWVNTSALISLGISISGYLITFVLQDRGTHPPLSAISNWLPFGLGKGIFLWPSAFLFPIFASIVWNGSELPHAWFGAVLTGFALAYLGAGQLLFKRAKEYRLPIHVFVYLLCLIAIPFASPNRSALLTSLLITVISAGLLAYLYNRIVETIIASLLFIWPFQLSLEILKVPSYSQSFGYVLLASLVYIPVAIYINRINKTNKQHHHYPIFLVGYALTVYAIVVSLSGRTSNNFIPWVGLTVPLIASLLYIFSTSYFKTSKYSVGWAWASVLTFAVAFGQGLTLIKLSPSYDALAWISLGVAYMVLERLLHRTQAPEAGKLERYWFEKFHWPLITGTLTLSMLGLCLSLPDTFAAFTGNHPANLLHPILAQLLLVCLSITSAWLYQLKWPLFAEPFLAFLPATLFFIAYGERIFHQPLSTPQYALVWTGLGIIHFLAGTYVDRLKVRYAHGLYAGAYMLLTWAVLWSLIEEKTLVWSFGLWILALLGSAVLIHFERHQTWEEFVALIFGKSKGVLQTTARNSFQWLAAWTFPIWLVLFLRQLNIPEEFAWLGLALPPLVYIGLAEWLQKIGVAYPNPLRTSAQFYTAIALFISAPFTMRHLAGDFFLAEWKTGLQAFITLQAIAVTFYILSAWRLGRRGFAHAASWLSFFPFTLAWILYDPAMSTFKFALPWMGLSAALLIVGFALDKIKIRYSHGPYLMGYLLSIFALLWSLLDKVTLVWSLAAWIIILIGSAIVVHFNRHQTWEEFVHQLFGDSKGIAKTFTHNAFQWLSAWAFPIWCVLFLRQLNVQPNFMWLGLVVPPLLYLGLAQWLQRFDSSYASPLRSSGHFYIFIGLLISAPATINYLSNLNGRVIANPQLGWVILQTIAVMFYALSAWTMKARSFAHLSAWLSIIPFTIAWNIYGFKFSPNSLVIPWLIWATLLLIIGFVLDRIKVRYAHGPYLAGYALAIFALANSISARLTNIYALAITILLAVVSHLVVHFGRHLSFEDFVNRFWKKTPEVIQQIVSTSFLFFASYAAPVLLAQILTHLKLDLPVRGVSLAIAAPLFIAIGLAVRNSKSRSINTVPTWPLYSSGYAITAIGAMISSGDERLAIYVLVLNTIVYAVSAYIFQQTFWLYLSTVLSPVIAILILHNTDNLETKWVAWIFIALAYLYLLIGQIFDRTKKSGHDIHPFAAPFYAPGFLLSAIALAISSSDKILALQVYSASVVLYALAGWLFQEALFIYPAAWLATVPYYLSITLMHLETRWYGLAWLPLIILYIALGRFVFHKRPLPPIGKGVLVEWLSHPATPFYLLAYSLSVSMISLSYISPLSLTLAFSAAAVIYFISAYLFRAPPWIYAGLFATHMTVLAYFTINPSGRPAYYITLPFLAMTWLTALFGYGFSRSITASDSTIKNEPFKLSLLNRLFGHPWSRPFFAFAIAEMFIWQTVAMKGLDTTIILGSGHALLLALFSLLWSEGALVYGVVGFGLLAAGAWMKQSGIAFNDAAAIYGGIGFGLYLFGRLLESISNRIKPLTVWLVPLTQSAVALTAVSVIINLPFVIGHMTAAAASLAFAGALYVAIAYRGRKYQLGYLGMALLEIAWALALYMSDVNQPQWYAIPGGLYFMGLAYLEWQRNRSKYAIGIELFGLGILLITSFTQSLNGTQGFFYFVLLMIESLLIIWWGTIQKRKIPFFTGIGFSALNIVAQVIVLVNIYNISIWLVGLGMGLIIMTIAVFVELRREQLRSRTREWTETLEKWE